MVSWIDLEKRGAISGNVRGMDHMGITVPDIEMATRFFHDTFDAAVVYDTVVDGHPRRWRQAVTGLHTKKLILL